MENIAGAWAGATAGGCGNYPTYGKNPAWAIHIKSPSEFFMRLGISSQTLPGKGQTQNPADFNICLGMALYRTNEK